MSGDVERDAETFDAKRWPQHLQPPPPKVLSANQLVAFNMWRARKASGWSQQEVADLLDMYTGRTWSNASVSAAERSWQGGRPRRFDASEIVALAQIFDEPVGFFFLPPEGGNYTAKHVGMKEFKDGQPNLDPDSSGNDLMALVPTEDLVQSLAYGKLSPSQVFRVQELTLQWLGLTWKQPELGMSIRPTPLRPGGEIDWAARAEDDSNLDSDEIGMFIQQNSAVLADAIIKEIRRRGVKLVKSESEEDGD
jgi:transcriptional regulator with XRE-family HTH domain